MDAMNGVLVVLILVVVAAIALAVVSSSRASGNRSAASLADAKADARRLIERLGGQVLNLSGNNDAVHAGDGRRVGAVHRRFVADRTGHHRQAGHAGQGKRDRGPVLRARRPHRDGHGSRVRSWRRWPVRSRRAPSPRTARLSSRAVRSRRPRCRRSAPRITTPVAGSRAAGPGRLVLRAMVEDGAGRRRLGGGLGTAV